MKRFAWLVCCLALVSLLCACAKKDNEMQEPANFYFVNTEISYNSATGVIQPELQEAIDFQGNLEKFIVAYIQGPKSSELQSYIPSDVELISVNVLDNIASITFSKEFAKLTGTDLTTTCSALLMSIHDFSGVEGIRIRAKNTRLDDKDEIFMTLDDIVLHDPVLINEE